MKKRIKENKFIMVILLIVIVAFGAGYYLKSVFFVASVNGKLVSRSYIRKEAEKRQGASILDSKVTELLVLQEAKKQGVTIEDQEITVEIEGIEKSVAAQGQSLEDILAFQGMTIDDLKFQIKMQMLVEKMLEDKIQVTDEEVQAYVDQNADTFPEEFDVEASKDLIKDQIKQQKMSSEFEPWLQELENKAVIEHFIEY